MEGVILGGWGLGCSLWVYTAFTTSKTITCKKLGRAEKIVPAFGIPGLRGGSGGIPFSWSGSEHKSADGSQTDLRDPLRLRPCHLKPG